MEREIFDREHAKILVSEKWIIDGFGLLASFYKRLDEADTLIYINLPSKLLAGNQAITQRFIHKA